MPDFGTDVNQLELSNISAISAKWYSHFEEPFDSFLKSQTHIPHYFTLCLITQDE